MFKVGDKVTICRQCSSCKPGEIYAVYKSERHYTKGELFIRNEKLKEEGYAGCSCQDKWRKVESFKIGDEITVSRKSCYYYQAPNLVGEIIEGSVGTNWHNVRFTNGYSNSYRDKDLIKVGGESMIRVGDKVESIKGYCKGQTGTVSKIKGDKIWCSNWSNGEGGYIVAQNLVLADANSTYNRILREIDDITSWDKRADDLLNEIKGKGWVDIAISNRKEGTDGRILIRHFPFNKGKTSREQKAEFAYCNQCDKLSAFKNAFKWLLNHSDIKKDEKANEIKQLKNEVSSLMDRIKKLERE